jgi:hypothetical protein
MHDQLAAAGHRMFIGSLFMGSEEAALTRLRERVESLDDTQYDAFIQAAQAMRTEAFANLREVQASGGNDAWGGAFEDRMAYMMAQIQTGDRSQSSARVQQAQTAVAGLGRVIELAEGYRHEKHAARAAQAARPALAAVAESRIQAMLEDVTRTGKLPEGLMAALSEVQDPAVLERLVDKLKALGGEAAGDRPLDNIADYYRPGAQPYELLWPLAQKLPMPFDELDRSTQFHVLFGECRRRLTEAASLRNSGALEQADAMYNECLQRADQLEVPILKSDAYQGLLCVAQMRGDRAAAKRYMQLAQREHERQCSQQP